MVVRDLEERKETVTLPLTLNLFLPKKPMIEGRMTKAPIRTANAVQILRFVAMLNGRVLVFIPGSLTTLVSFVLSAAAWEIVLTAP